MSEDFFQKLGGLFDEAALRHPDNAGIVLRVVADHFSATPLHSPGDLARIETIMLRALATARLGFVEAIAERFARHAQAPASVLAALAASSETAACLVYAHGKTVPRPALLQQAERGPPLVAAAIAGRPDIDPALSASLVRRPEPEILLALAGNPHARLDAAALAWLVSRGRHDRALGERLLARGPLPCDTTPLFLAATREQRVAMIFEARRRDLGLVPQRAPEPDAALREALDSDDPTAAAGFFAARLAISRGEAETLATDAGGEPLALMLCATGTDGPLAASTFLLLLGIGARDPRLEGLRTMVATIAPQTARNILERILGRPVMKTQIATRAAPASHDRRAAGVAKPARAVARRAFGS